MDNKSKLFLAFGAGAVIGAGILALLTTDEGKAFVEKAKGQMDDLAEDVKKTVKDLENEFTDFLKTDKPQDDAKA